MLPVIVIGENAPRMEHIGKSIPSAECVPLRNVRFNMDTARQPLPSLLAPSIIVLDMEAEATGEVGRYIKRLKTAYFDSAVLVLLPFGDGVGEQAALEAGADDILMRPVSVNRLSLTLRNLSEMVNRRIVMAAPSGWNGVGEVMHDRINLLNSDGKMKRLHHLEQEIIQYAVKHCQGHISQAARALGIGRSTLYRKMDAMETRIKFQQRIQSTRSTVMAN
jgi:DNA-binding NtrC family response regulator